MVRAAFVLSINHNLFTTRISICHDTSLLFRTNCRHQNFSRLPDYRLFHFVVRHFTLYLPVMTVDDFANSLDPDQARQNVGPDLDPNCLTL